MWQRWRSGKRKSDISAGASEIVITPSPDRVDPPCPYFRRCGGCHYQHIEYGRQVEMKGRQVAEVFERIGKFAAPPVEPVLASPAPYGYRGKGEFHVERSRDGAYRIGFMDVGGTRLVDIERCAIMEESINEQLAYLRQPMHAPPRVDRYVIWSLTGKSEEKHVVRIVKGKEILVPFEGFFQANTALTDGLVDTGCSISPGSARTKRSSTSTAVRAFSRCSWHPPGKSSSVSRSTARPLNAPG